MKNLMTVLLVIATAVTTYVSTTYIDNTSGVVFGSLPIIIFSQKWGQLLSKNVLIVAIATLLLANFAANIKPYL